MLAQTYTFTIRPARYLNFSGQYDHFFFVNSICKLKKIFFSFLIYKVNIEERREFERQFQELQAALTKINSDRQELIKEENELSEKFDKLRVEKVVITKFVSYNDIP